MIPTHRRHNFSSGRGQPGKLDGRFNGFGARVAEEESVNAGRCDARQGLQQKRSLVIVEELGAVEQLLRLFLNGSIDIRVLVPQIGGPLAPDTIDVLVPSLVPKFGSFATDDGNLAFEIRASTVEIFSFLN